MITKKLRIESCRCGLAVYVGMAEGMPVTLDVVALTAEGELAAMMANRLTFTVRNGDPVERTVDRIGDPKLDVLPRVRTHQCDSPLPPLHHRAAWPTTLTPSTKECPF